MSKIFQKTTEKFDKFLPWNLKSGQIIRQNEFNTMNSSYLNYSSVRNCLYFDDFNTFLVLGQKFVKFFGGFLENFKNQKDILKLTDLVRQLDIFICRHQKIPIDFQRRFCRPKIK